MLKARAHGLEPVVIIGGKGLTDEAVKEVDRALTAHELIKVRAPSLDRVPTTTGVAGPGARMPGLRAPASVPRPR